MQLRWIRANGLEFAYFERGQGPLVLCLHGFPDTARSFLPVLEHLAAAGYRAVAPFMRGYAPTSLPPDGDYAVPALGRDVLALIEHLGGDPAFLLGHDWGAAASYAAATMRPDRVRAIVTAAVPHLRRFMFWPTARQLRRSRYMGFFQLRGPPERTIPADDFRWLEDLVREWSPGWHFGATEMAPLKALFADPARLQAALGYYRAMPAALATADGWKLLMTKCPVPARVIRGSDDGCIGREMFERQAHCFGAGYELVEIEGAGHFMQCERPEDFSRLAIEFFDRHRT